MSEESSQPKRFRSKSRRPAEEAAGELAGGSSGYEVGQGFELDDESDGACVDDAKAPARITVSAKTKGADDGQAQARAPRRAAEIEAPQPSRRGWIASFGLGFGQVIGAGLITSPMFFSIFEASSAVPRFLSVMTVGTVPAVLTLSLLGGNILGEFASIAVLLGSPLVCALALTLLFRRGLKSQGAVWTVLGILIAVNLISLPLAKHMLLSLGLG